ncbi:MAG: hypothetical protein IKC40_02650 [Oscillospiraceae bacterium]|nr:hypothetical protein [Oscillospiraceae bacterium]
MKGKFQKLRFGHMDEMQQMHYYRSQSYAYGFLLAALFIWAIYESVTTLRYHDDLNLVPCYLMVGASLIQNFSQLIMQRNAVKDDDEYDSSQPLFKIILLACAIAVIINLVTTAIIMLVVKL